MALYLNRERMRLVKVNEKGRVTKRKKYKFGDEVDTSFFDSEEQEGRLDALVEKGTLVESEDDLDRYAGFRHRAGISASSQRGQATTVGAVAGAALAPGADHSDLDEDGATGDAESATLVPEPTHEDQPQGAGAATTASEGADDPTEMVDQYSSMDYTELQEAAKDAGLKYVGVSADDLRANLRESDES